MSLWITFERLFQAGIKSPVALVATCACALKPGDKRVFSVDGHGRWVNRQQSATFVSPTIHALRYSDVKQRVLDYWCVHYRPAPGDTVIDVGAGLGEETVIFSHLVGPTGRVISIEAHPDTFAALCETIQRSGLGNITPLQCAASGEEGVLHISNSSNHITNNVIDGSGDVRVPARTLESICAELGIARVNFLKMNIEGAERFAVKGIGPLPILNIAVSCHDFVAEEGASDVFRTKAEVALDLAGRGYTLSAKSDFRNACERDTLYATLEESARSAEPSISRSAAAAL
jgi:FkbM family methyltransferase